MNKILPPVPEQYRLSPHHHERYLLSARRQGFGRLLQSTQEDLGGWMENQRRPSISWSAGKDSTACLIMALEIHPGIDVVTQCDDLDVPEKMPYIEFMRERYDLNLHIVRPAFSLKNRALHGDDDLAENIHSSAAAFSKDSFYSLLDEFEKCMQFTGRIMGLRKAESYGRLMNFCVRGKEYTLKSGIDVCNPIARWSAEHVFAFLCSRDIPINPIYRKVELIEGENPELIRSNWLVPGSHARRGAAAWIRYHYPQWWSELTNAKKDLGRYA